MEFVRWLDENASPAELGGKAAAVGDLLRGGFPVPPGFCLTTAAYRRWQQVGRPDRLPPEVAAELGAAVSRLTSLGMGGPVALLAVRSSAVAEDSPTASFAGQLVTRLGVPPAAVEAAVLEVWASATAPGARAYGARTGVADPETAVLIQPMVPADAAGVVFTADPVSGDPTRMVINAAWGLGEAVVGGLISPDHWVVEKATGRVLETQVGDKEVMVTLDPAGGIRRVPTPPDLRRQPALGAEILRQVCRLACQVEARGGLPQDIEFAVAGGRVYILQARPVTVRPAEGWVSEFDSETDPDTVWTAANIQEVLPGLVTPLTWSAMQENLNYAFRKPYLETGTLTDPNRVFVAQFYGRVFLSVSALRDVAARAIGTSPEAVDEQYLGRTHGPDRPRRVFDPKKIPVYVYTTPKIVAFVRRTPKDVRRALLRLEPLLGQVRSRNLSALSPAELLALRDELNREVREVGALHIATSSGASIFFESLLQFLRARFGSDAYELQARLITGLADIPSARPGLELWELAQLACQDPALKLALLDRDPWSEISRLESPLAGEFRQGLAAFLRKYGHRSMMEAELAAPAWEEDPNAVLGLVRNFVAVPPEAAPNLVIERQAAERLETTRLVERRLGPIQRRLFRWLLGQAQRYVALREQTKSLWMGVTHLVRRVYRELGRRLAGAGLLEDPQDIYFLTAAEVGELVQAGLAASEARQRIRRRRAEFERNRQVRLPESFSGRPKPAFGEPPALAAAVLRGIPVSPGVVTGPARVIVDPRVQPEIRPGEILVAPVTDAGWTPLFLVAAGLVVDVGGPLSHGSIVAREYGIPAVVNVKTAVSLVRTGQTVTVDGCRGEVHLHPEG